MNWISFLECLSPLAAVALVCVCLFRFQRAAGSPNGLRHLPGWLEQGALWCTSSLVAPLARYAWMPSFLNGMGLLLCAGAGAVYAVGAAPLAGWLLLLGGLCDTLDGRTARQRRAASRRGAFADSVLDRYSEMAVYTGLAWHFREGDGLFWAWSALFFSFMVSYTRARAEGLGYALRGGLMQRPQRLALLIAASIFSPVGRIFWDVGDPVMLGGVALVAILSAFTAVRRLVAGLRALGEKEDHP